MNYKTKIEKNMDKINTNEIKIVGLAKEGIAFDITIPSNIDMLDFVEEIGQYFYKIDVPSFGQKFITNETKDYIYHWLVQLLNTGNYEQKKDKTILHFNMEVDFNLVGSFQFAIEKYKTKLYQDQLNNKPEYILYSEQIAIDLLEIIEIIRNL